MPVYLDLTNTLIGSGLVRFELVSFSNGVATPYDLTSGSGTGVGKPKFKEVVVSKTLDGASPLFVRACTTGVILPAVQLTFTEKDPARVYYEIKMQDCLVSSYDVSGQGAGDALPTEMISFAYTKIEYRSYEPRSHASISHFGWDLRNGKAI